MRWRRSVMRRCEWRRPRNWVGPGRQGQPAAWRWRTLMRPRTTLTPCWTAFSTTTATISPTSALPFRGVEEALQALADRGAKLAVVTNKREELTNRLLAEIDFAHHFQAGGGRGQHGPPQAGGGPGPRRLRRLAGAAGRCAVRWRLASGTWAAPGAAGCAVVCVALRLSSRVGGGRLGRGRRH